MKKRVLLLIGIFFFISPFFVLAQSGNDDAGSPDAKPVIQQGPDGEEQGNARESQKCENVTRRMSSVTSRYDANKERYMNAFQNIYQNIDELVLRLKNDGYDTTELEEHLAQYNEMIQNSNRYYNEFRTGLDNSKQGVCGNRDAEAKQQFNSARTQLMSCKNEMLELRTYAQETLREDILNLREEIAE
jgi:uncharacterized phage infection (PIP) family protein YhgE